MKAPIRFLLTLALLAAAFSPGRVAAQANVTFGGGLGTPLLLTIDAPVLYVITTAATNAQLGFILQGTGNVLLGAHIATGTLTYSINNGTPITLNGMQTGSTLGTSVSPTDMILYINTGAASTLAVGDSVRLLAGKLTTSDNVAAAPPANGAYQTFVISPNSTKLDAVNGTAVPEPSTWALLGAGVAGVGFVTLRRRQARV